MLTGEVYYGTLVLSMACALAAAWLLLRQAATPLGIILASLLLILSPTFVSYSTSGLGTPLVHLLVAAFAIGACNRGETGSHTRWGFIATMAALAALTDALTLLITLPVIGRHSPLASREGGQPPSQTWRQSPPDARGLSLVSLTLSLAIPVTALLLWAALAIYYYGSLVPMATLARLNQLTPADRLHAGAAFLADAVRRDPILVATLIVGLALPFVQRTAERALAAGALLYTVAIVATGGSTWSGYGLTIPFVVAVLVIARQPALAMRRIAAPALAAVAILAVIAPVHTIASHAQYGLYAPPQVGIIDPRLQDYQATGLMRVRRNQWFPDHPESIRGLQAGEAQQAIASSPRPGFFGYAAGRSVHVLDPTGLGDPLLARLPPSSPVTPGHSIVELRPRTPPDGYIESLLADRNAITNPALAAFYERVRFVTRGRLQARGRATNAALLALDRRAPASSAGGRN